MIVMAARAMLFYGVDDDDGECRRLPLGMLEDGAVL